MDSIRKDVAVDHLTNLKRRREEFTPHLRINRRFLGGAGGHIDLICEEWCRVTIKKNIERKTGCAVQARDFIGKV